MININTVESRNFEVKGTGDLISNYRKFELKEACDNRDTIITIGVSFYAISSTI